MFFCYFSYESGQSTLDYGVKVVQKLLDLCTYGNNMQLFAMARVCAEVYVSCY